MGIFVFNMGTPIAQFIKNLAAAHQKRLMISI